MSHSLQTAAAERRIARRRKPKNSAKVVCLKGSFGLGRNLAVAVLDVSETGIRLVVKEALPVNQEIEITLESISCPRPVKQIARVVWCVATADSNWCIGAHFDKLLRFNELQGLSTT
jgi:hypothetical protein